MDDFKKKLETIVVGKNLNYSLYALKTKNDRIIATKIELGNENLYNFLKSALLYLMAKKYSKLQFKEYPYGIPKDHIEYVSLIEDANNQDGDQTSNAKQIKLKVSELENAILNPETNDIDLKAYTSYAIICTANDERTYFITNKRLIKNFGSKNALFRAVLNSQYKLFDESLLNLVYHFDSVITKENYYFITLESEELFGLDSYCRKRTTACKDDLRKLNIATGNDINLIDAFLKKPGHYSVLKNYDKKTLENLSNVTNNTKDILKQKYRLDFVEAEDGTYKVDLSTDQKIRNFINTITNKRGKNFDDEVVESSSPLKLCK